MPKRTDIKSVLIIGAGPIVIGQACEFDYSGAQACKALREEGFRVILVNSNPATIMTDPEMADAIYIEPVHWRAVERIIEKERPDALLPTMGGQTGLNCALDLAREGVLEKYDVELIAAKREAIDMAEDRDLFRKAMTDIGLEVPARRYRAFARGGAREAGGHWLSRPSSGPRSRWAAPVAASPTTARNSSASSRMGSRCPRRPKCCSRSRSSAGRNSRWRSFATSNDNCIIVCSIENLDPMGVHTGDSITVAPSQTLTDKEYQRLRDASIDVLRKIGVETGGSNVQFAVSPEDGRVLIIEMNPACRVRPRWRRRPRVSRSPKSPRKLAVGYTLDELQNEITGGATPASFEPSIDYVVTKIPRFTFEKFPGTSDRLTTQMKSVGEVMAIGRTFQESVQKALRGLEIGDRRGSMKTSAVRTEAER